jgi:glycosyltransferase involved in cell wall biosynthesis
MRIGIDVSQITSSFQTGLYNYVFQLLKGLRSVKSRDRILLYAQYTLEWKEHQSRLKSRLGELGLSFRWHGDYRRPYRLRQRLSGIDRVNVFFHMTHHGFPKNPQQCHICLVPDLTILHLSQYHNQETIEWWSRLFDQARRYASLVVTYSEHTKADLVKTLGIPAERIRAIPLAAGLEFRPPPPEDGARLAAQLGRWGLDRGRYVLSVGMLEPRKNHALILDAYSLLKSRGQVPPGFKLVFAGGLGWGYEPLLEQIPKLGLSDDVVLVGHAESLADLYGGALMMVYPSLMEGFGLPPLEAMACGVPVITSNTTSLPEVVGDAALMVDPHDAEGLAEAMAQVLEDAALRDELSARGLRRASEFSWERTVAETLEAIHQAHDSWQKGKASLV